MGRYKKKLIITRSPLRITLGGGGTDIPMFYKKFGGNFVSAAINLHVYISINKINENRYVLRYSKFENCEKIDQINHPIIKSVLAYFKVGPGLEITSFADIKAGTGLGSSGAFTVALIKAVSIYKRQNLSNKKIAEIASHIEINILKEPVGIQDTYASALGSVRYFTINQNGAIRSKDLLSYNPKLKPYLNNFYIIYTEQERNASKEIDKTIFKTNSKQQVFDNLNKAKNIGLKAKKLLLSEDNLSAFSSELTDQWKIKLERSPSNFHKLVNKDIESLISLGCEGGKLVGAGGGGFILINCPKNNIANVKKYLKSKNKQLVNFDIDRSGTEAFEL